MIETYANELIATLLVSLRIAPTLAFAPPFTLLRIPSLLRLLLSLSLGFWIAAASSAPIPIIAPNQLLQAIFSELLLGITLALSLQLAFAAMLTAGRAIDFQVGFGLAVLADPTLRTQMPLVGALFAYAAGAVFFATNGPADLVGIWAQTLERVPPGAYAATINLPALLSYTAAVFTMAIGLAGIVMATLFLLDVTIALMSRTLPQMNMLVLGFQVKTLALLLTLPFVFAFSGAIFLRIVRLAIDTTPRLL